MFYKLIPSNETTGKLFIPKRLFKRHVFTNLDSVVISAGGVKQSIEVILDSKLNNDELRMSMDTLESLSIPGDISYQVILEKNTINLGPIIGLLMATTDDKLTKARLRKLIDYCVIYPEIKGLIVAFSEEGIDFENHRVKGYYFNPKVKGKVIPWKEGTFPLPDSIFQRTNLTEEVRVQLIKETKNRVFNSNYFNKWEFGKMLSKFEPYLRCIPETLLFKSIDDIDYMLSRHDAVYLKPVNGTLSRGLYRITRKNGCYGFQGNQGSEITQVNSKDEAETYVKDVVGKKTYLVQQAISPLKVEDRHLDFRVIMQKDHTLTWSCTGIVGFVGNLGDICTNWGFTSTFEGILSKYFNLTQQEIFKKRQEIIAACRKVCEAIDLRKGNYGDLGFDVMLDKELKIWILEANKRHYHTVPLWINDMHMYHEIKSKPIKYAAALGGFSVY